MTTESSGAGKTGKRLSLDAWAVIVGLLLALIIKLGIVNTVPW